MLLRRISGKKQKNKNGLYWEKIFMVLESENETIYLNSNFKIDTTQL